MIILLLSNTLTCYVEASKKCDKFHDIGSIIMQHISKMSVSHIMCLIFPALINCFTLLFDFKIIDAKFFKYSCLN